MNKLIVFLLAGICFFACKSDRKDSGEIVEVPVSDSSFDIIRNPVTADGMEDTSMLARIVFEKDTFNFGRVKSGKMVEYSFRFTNTGKTPLIITDARSTCGCTVPSFPKNPIEPGKGGVINVKFDTTNKSEDQDKPVTITANTYPRETKVRIIGYVENKSRNIAPADESVKENE